MLQNFFTFCITLSLVYFVYRFLNRLKFSRLTNFSKKVIFITGCDSGIGKKAARYFHGLGFVVFAGCLDSKSPGAEELRSLYEESGNSSNDSLSSLQDGICNDSSTVCKLNRMHVVQIDITQTDSVRMAVDRVEEFLKRHKELSFHCLVNNAGVCIVGEFDWFTLDHMQKIVNVNLLGTMRTIKLFLGLIIKHKSRILTIGSVNAIYAYPGISVYCATKSALNLFCNSLRFEMTKFGVRVLVLNPGDYAKKTNIMANQAVYFEEMQQQFSIEQRVLYENYMKKYIEMTEKNVGLTGSEDSDRILFKDLDSLLTQSDPPNEILSVPLLNRIVLFVFFSLPINLQIYIFQKVWNRFVTLESPNASRRDSSSRNTSNQNSDTMKL